ncbi:MAG: UDP-glucose 4-epimerase [Desulfobacterales bacterium]|nr:MAG: UDP-glucose 4-epimerase [Desulfobacterales bacterium]
MFDNKTLLITGGTGSFGNAVLNHFLSTAIKEIRIFSRDEKKQDDMRRRYKNEKIKYYIGDVRDYGSIKCAIKNVDYVFHAAALKQVPSCEFYPIQAVKTNVMGTENVLNASIAGNVKKVIVLSTDKAVYPINAMGMTKALSEKVMAARSRGDDNISTLLCATRYGNVMASRGSVIPLFVEQAISGMPITVTDPKMTRFLMSLEESVALVLFAFNNMQPGDIFVQKAPAATVMDLAIAIKTLFNSSSEIRIIGTRHGEKRYETLLSREEKIRAEDLGGYYRVPSDNRDLNYDKFFIDGDVQTSTIEDYTSHNTKRLGIEEIKKRLMKLDFIKKRLGECML